MLPNVRTDWHIHRGGRQSLIDNKTIDLVTTLIDANPSSRYAHWLQVFPPKTALLYQSLSRVLDDESISLKLSRDLPGERNSLCIKKVDRKMYAQWMVGYGIQMFMLIKHY